ncbi:Branched-chain amino acid aminotransferase/4-amino-4-deoxychorismate lyase [Pseudoxanthomonas sp. GM95]|uniref:aminotransferase class IV n=1 Tax=Pseudoxanthomonas sp. GM95 TaxID=1881043 RepID=UPI0008C08802|nr:aminotransferase class IV [Pseudoxanthomonas sp. GM95]SEK84703.1 Branched-chain amino acid aminotransferase/4-amino-4-deoxychorismate lyase [Pseudoxanthomonas sp. GM95]
MSAPTLYCGARPVDEADLRALAALSYGHFTAMRVRDGAVQGLGLHLARLREGHATLFDADFDADALRDMLRTVLAGQGEASVRITGFARDFNYRDPLKIVTPEWLISVAAAAPIAQASPLTLKCFAFVRPLPQIKHVAMAPLFHYRRQARKAGCDDALFVDALQPSGRVVEGTVWNIGFWDGACVHWPEAPALRGTCEGLLQRGLAALGVSQNTGEVTLAQAKCWSAFTANANGCTPVGAIDGVSLPAAPGLQGLLDQALASQPWERI